MWQRITTDQFILQTVQGYRLEFFAVPQQVVAPVTVVKGLTQQNVMQEEIEKLLLKEVSFTEQRPVCFAPIFSSQKDWESSAGDKSSSVEQIYNSQALQDGELAERDSVGAQGRLHGHNRFKRCLFFDSNSPVSLKISLFQLEEPAVSVCCSSVWPYQCSTSIHESFETGHSKYATKGNSMSNLYRRPNYRGIFQDGMQRAGRVCSSVVNRSRFQCKYGKIKLSAENSSGVPRVCVGFDKNGAFSTGEEEREHSSKNSKLTHEQTNFSSSSFKYGRLDAVGQMGSNASGYLLPISSTGFEQCSGRNRERLRLAHNVKSRSSAGAKDVETNLEMWHGRAMVMSRPSLIIQTDASC